MKYLDPFTYRHIDGKDYIIECAVEYRPAATDNPMQADCPEDLEYYLEVLDLCVVDSDTLVDVTDKLCNDIPDHIFLREIDFAMETEHSIAELPEKNIWTEGEYYYGE